MKPTLNPYLNFSGKTKDAMEFYHSVFGGDLSVQTFGEAVPDCSDEEKSLIMHARLEADGMVIMASDGNKEHPVHMGDNVNLSLQGSDEAKLTDWFNKLSEDGNVDMSLAKQFWGDTFGMLTDKFGVHWMVNITSAPQAS